MGLWCGVARPLRDDGCGVGHGVQDSVFNGIPPTDHRRTAHRRSRPVLRVAARVLVRQGEKSLGVYTLGDRLVVVGGVCYRQGVARMVVGSAGAVDEFCDDAQHDGSLWRVSDDLSDLARARVPLVRHTSPFFDPIDVNAL